MRALRVLDVLYTLRPLADSPACIAFNSTASPRSGAPPHFNGMAVPISGAAPPLAAKPLYLYARVLHSGAPSTSTARRFFLRARLHYPSAPPLQLYARCLLLGHRAGARARTGNAVVEDVDVAVPAPVEDLLQRVPRTVRPRVPHRLQSRPEVTPTSRERGLLLRKRGGTGERHRVGLRRILGKSTEGGVVRDEHDEGEIRWFPKGFRVRSSVFSMQRDGEEGERTDVKARARTRTVGCATTAAAAATAIKTTTLFAFAAMFSLISRPH